MNAREPVSAPAVPFAPFAELAGKRRYRLGSLLGEGGNGVVFRATCCETGQASRSS
ncbi:hypothetical protein CSX04_05083 [Burkholderia cepacia]|nr:hypothetical protein CSX04_05083 [Burkholderia cepacia]